MTDGRTHEFTYPKTKVKAKTYGNQIDLTRWIRVPGLCVAVVGERTGFVARCYVGVDDDPMAVGGGSD